jgi:hypothetical protein
LSEAVSSDPKAYYIPHILNSTPLNTSLFGKYDPIADGLFRDRLMFTQRALTYESDVLNAFRGLLKRSPCLTLWGVPTIPAGAKMDPHTGFALGLLWVRRPSWSVPAHVPSTTGTLYSRRHGFPNWSWTSVVGEIFNEGYGEQSNFGAHLLASKEITPRNDTHIRFWPFSKGQPVPLAELLEQRSADTLSEDSPCLLVERNLVKVRWDYKTQCYDFCGQEDLPYNIPVAFDVDHHTMPASPAQSGPSAVEDALVLIEWHDSQQTGKRRLVMMLLEWIGRDFCLIIDEDMMSMRSDVSQGCETGDESKFRFEQVER